MVRPTFLVDGFVAGTWELAGSTLRVSPFRALSDEDADAVLDEAQRLHPFITPGMGATPEIVFTVAPASMSRA